MRSTSLRSPAGVQRARWWIFPTPQELPASGLISRLAHRMRSRRHRRWTKRRDEGRLRPPPLRHLRRQQAGCERHCDANAVTQSSRNMAGAPFAGFYRRCAMIVDDLLDVLKQMAPALVLLSTTAILWW